MLITLEELKTYLWITDNSEDDLLNNLIEYSSDFIKNYTWRDFEASDYTEYINWNGERKFNLKQFPIISLNSFKYNTWTFTSEVWVDFDEDTYKIEKETWIMFLNFFLNVWIKNIEIKYRAWYEEIPWNIKNIALKICSFQYNTRKSSWISSENVDGTGFVFSDKIPDNITLSLNNIRNV